MRPSTAFLGDLMNSHSFPSTYRLITRTPGMNRARIACAVTATVAAVCFTCAALIDVPVLSPMLYLIAVFASIGGCTLTVFCVPSHLCITVRMQCPIRPTDVEILVEED